MPRTVDPDLNATRRKQILDAAARCFAARGFHQTTMQEITAASGMSAGGLYRYFKTKDDIIVAIAEQEGAENQSLVDFLHASPNPLTALELATPEILNALAEPAYGHLSIEIAAEALRNPRVAEIIQHNQNRLKSDLTDVLARGQDAGTIDRSIPARHLAELIVSIFEGLVTAGPAAGESDYEGFQEALLVLLRRLLRP